MNMLSCDFTTADPVSKDLEDENAGVASIYVPIRIVFLERP